MKNKKGFISFDAVILGAIILILLAGFMPKIRLAIGEYGTRTGNQILMYETGTGSHLAANPGGTTGVNPDDYIVDDSLMVDKVVVTRKLYFADPYPQVNTDEMITLTVIAEPDDISYQGIAWNILSGGSHAYIIKSRDSKSVEITGVTPGRIVLQASAKDASGKVAYAYVDVIRQPQSIYLDQTKINLKVSDPANKTKTVTATVLPADTTNNYVVWSYENPTGSECTSFTTNGHNITITAKKPEGISCNNVTVKIKATTADPNIYTVLEVVVNE